MALCILNSVPCGVEFFSFRPGQFTRRRNSPYSLNTRVCENVDAVEPLAVPHKRKLSCIRSLYIVKVNDIKKTMI